MNQTTINHKFKNGDKVQLINGTSNNVLIICGLEYLVSVDCDAAAIMYRVKNEETNYYGWYAEDRLKLVEEVVSGQ